MGKIVHQPYDKLIKATLHDLERAEEFLHAHLSQKVKKYVDFNKGIALVNKEFIKKTQRELRFDVIYKAHIKNREGYIYAHVEGQSTPEELLPIRILAYDLEIITLHWENHGTIPPIINLILYNGKESPYPYPINVLDLLEDHPVAKELLLEGNTLIDLSVHKDSEIEKHHKTALMELLLKHSRQQDFYSFLQKLKEKGKFKALLRYYNKGYIEFILLFIADVLKAGNHDGEDILDLFMNRSPEIDSGIMTERKASEQKCINLGIQQGLQQGIQISIVALNMLSLGQPISKIKKFTGLTDQQIQQLIKNK